MSGRTIAGLDNHICLPGLNSVPLTPSPPPREGENRAPSLDQTPAGRYLDADKRQGWLARAAASVLFTNSVGVCGNGFLVARDRFAFPTAQFLPFSRRQIAQFQTADLHTNQAQRWMADRGGHAPHLAVLAFDQFQTDPAIRNALPKTDRRIARRQFRPGFQQPRAARQGPPPENHHASFQLPQRLGVRDPLYLSPINPPMSVARVQQPFIELRLIAQQQQSFALSVQPSNGVNAGRKTEFRQRASPGTVRRKLRDDPVRLVKGDEHRSER